MASRDEGGSPRSAPRRHGAAAPKDGPDLLSPRFRSAAELAGWDEESILLAVVEDTPVRESRRKRRASTSSSAGGSNGSSARKRRPRRQSPARIPPVVLALDDDDDKTDTAADGKSEEKVVPVGDKEASGSGDKAAATGNMPCMDRLREELSCAICLEICFEPTTTPCGHSFCMKCLRHAVAKCGKQCPKCRQLMSNSRSCTINTVLWNTIQLLFPSEVEARKSSTPSPCDKDVNRSPLGANRFSQGGTGMRTRARSSSSSFINHTEGRTRSSYRTFIEPGNTTSTNTSANFMTHTEGRTRRSYRTFIEPGSTTSTNTSANFVSTHGHGSTRNSNSRSRGFVPASQLMLPRGAVSLDQAEDAALAYRLQQEEFMNAFEEPEQERQPRNTVSTARDALRAMANALEEPEQERQPRNTVSTARDTLRAMASRVVRLRARGWPV